jgi:NAD(P)-dependent dehydrogenase (short-subunit alcohol dehydrogenase family)
MTLEGKSVVVTGGAGGLGRYIALGCAQRGAHVTIGDVNDAMLTRTESEIAAIGNGVLALHCDVREEEDAKALMDGAASHFGTIDYLVNNAGIAPQARWKPRWSPVREMEYDFWKNIFDTNAFGAFLCAKHAIPYMERQRSGHIVNVHSGLGGLVPPVSAAYVMSKNVLVIFTRFLAEQEREFGICVMAIGPGGGYATETAPEEIRAVMPGPEISGDRYFLAADAGMELSGRVVDVADGVLVPIDLELHHETLAEGSPTAAARRG